MPAPPAQGGTRVRSRAAEPAMLSSAGTSPSRCGYGVCSARARPAVRHHSYNQSSVPSAAATAVRERRARHTPTSHSVTTLVAEVGHFWETAVL